jgi:TonB family protein
MITPIALDNLLAYVFQSSVLIAAAVAALWIFRIDAPSVRYLALRITLVASLVLPLLQPRVLVPFDASELPVQTVNAPPPAAAGGAPALPFTFAATATSKRPSTALVAIVLAAGLVGRLLWLAVGLWRLHSLRRVGETSGGEEYADLQETIGTRAELRYVAALGQPLTFGVRVPLILLPVSIRELPEHIRRAVVAHELWHVRRRDWMFTISEEALRAAFWFHPAVWMLLSRIQICREETVDELAVLTTGSRRAYLDALLAFVDARPLFATTAFARRRHLVHRMLMVSKESAMSSQRLVASCAAVLLAVGAAALTGAAAFPLSAQQNPPRDPPPPPPPAPTSSHQMVFVSQGEAELRAAIEKDPKNANLYGALARHYLQTGDFERAVATLESLALVDPSSAQHHQTLAVLYWEKAFRDTTLSREQKTTYLLAGIAATDRALELNPDYPEAMTYKNILLRTLATYTTDSAEQGRMMQEADLLRARAMELMKQRGTAAGVALRQADAMPPPPPPPPPPFGMVDGMAPLRVGGSIPVPAKIKDADAVYPPIARAAGVTGAVIIEAVIDTDGRVRDARVLRSIPLLDEAALNAVKEWQYTPTILQGVARPVIMTLTVNFSLQ